MFKSYLNFQSLLSCLVLTSAVMGLAKASVAEGSSSNQDALLVTIKARHSLKCLDVSPDNSVIQNDCNSSPTQQWKLIVVNEDSILIQSAASDKYMSVLGSSPDHFADVVVEPHTGEAHQLFAPLNIGGDHTQLRAVHSEYCLDVSGHSKNAGANIHQYKCHNEAQVSAGNQTFDIESISNAASISNLKHELNFSRIDDELNIYVNNELVFNHGILRYNQEPVKVDISKHLISGKENKVRVVGINGPSLAELEGILLRDGQTVDNVKYESSSMIQHGVFYDESFTILN